MKKTTKPIKTFHLADLRRLSNDELPKITGGEHPSDAGTKK